MFTISDRFSKFVFKPFTKFLALTLTNLISFSFYCNIVVLDVHHAINTSVYCFVADKIIISFQIFVKTVDLIKSNAIH